MKTYTTLRALLMLALAGLMAAAVRADVVETSEGARLVGKISKIDAGTIYLDTAYAGTIQIKQSDVTSVTTDAPIAVRLVSGTRIDGTVSTESTGELKVANSEGAVTTPVGKVAASWAAGQEDPALAALRRHWAFEASANITGKSGNTSANSQAASFTATLISPQDALKLYALVDHSQQNGVKTSDDTKGGINYQDYFSDALGWYVETELERNTVAGVNFRSTTDAGLSVRFIKNARQTFSGHVGAGYRFESYINNTHENGAVLSFGLNNSYQFSQSLLMTNELDYTPSVNNFQNYLVFHDSEFQIPVGASGFWRLGMGVSNTYNSLPVAGLKRLDTTYYARLILSWK